MTRRKERRGPSKAAALAHEEDKRQGARRGIGSGMNKKGEEEAPWYPQKRGREACSVLFQSTAEKGEAVIFFGLAEAEK